MSSPSFSVGNGGNDTQRVERIGDEWQEIEDEVGKGGEDNGRGRGRGEKERGQKGSGKWVDKGAVEDEEEEYGGEEGARVEDYVR